MPEEATFCPNCGRPLNAEGPYHNQDQRNGGNRNWNAPFYQQKDTGITIVLGVLLGLFGIMGVGQMYVGKAVRGIAILLGGFCIVVLSYVAIVSYILSDIWYDDVYYESGLEGLIVIGIVITAVHFAYFIWQAYDAHKLAKRSTRSCTGPDGRRGDTGRRPPAVPVFHFLQIEKRFFVLFL